MVLQWTIPSHMINLWTSRRRQNDVRWSCQVDGRCSRQADLRVWCHHHLNDRQSKRVSCCRHVAVGERNPEVVVGVCAWDGDDVISARRDRDVIDSDRKRGGCRYVRLEDHGSDVNHGDGDVCVE